MYFVGIVTKGERFVSPDVCWKRLSLEGKGLAIDLRGEQSFFMHWWKRRIGGMST